MLLRRRARSAPIPRTPAGATLAGAGSLPVDGNSIAADDYYYAWQLARIVARLHELRRRRARRARQRAQA